MEYFPIFFFKKKRASKRNNFLYLKESAAVIAAVFDVSPSEALSPRHFSVVWT